MHMADSSHTRHLTLPSSVEPTMYASRSTQPMPQISSLSGEHCVARNMLVQKRLTSPEHRPALCLVAARQTLLTLSVREWAEALLVKGNTKGLCTSRRRLGVLGHALVSP